MTTTTKRQRDTDKIKAKKVKTAEDEIKSCFAPDIFTDNFKEKVKQSIAESFPYKHGVINPLIDDDLLRRVRDEILKELHFTKKETDIYKVHQTGDLANLSGLDPEELSRLSSLNQLRNALYSQEFRDFLSQVSGTGPLSGIKKDLSINIYEKGCHLLTHDDVIGSRRISYILYLPNPDEAWKPQWGGALRLYPTVKPNIPQSDWSLAIAPAWNQLAFFNVQPGLSFHDVEEVYVDKTRLSISGWFHIPQAGEKGYIEGEQEETESLSSLKQLESREVQYLDFPKKSYQGYGDKSSEGDLTDEDIEYLSRYMNSKLLTQESLTTLNDIFCEESSVEIRDFLNSKYAKSLRDAIDIDDLAPVPANSKEIPEPWNLARPPHKAMYMYLESSKACDDETQLESHKRLIEVCNMLKHPSFSKWLRKLSSLTPEGAWVLARRFRPGHDFSLATTHDSTESVLEGTLSLTPTKGWVDGEVGGYDLCMSIDEDSSADPAIYRGAIQNADDDPVLLTSQARWNVFNLIVRDQGILRFVKYISKNAPGSRWDVSAEWTLKEEEEEEEEEEEKEEKE